MVERTMSIKTKPQPEEKQILQLITSAKRDPQMFGDLYLLYAQPVFRYLYSRIGSVSEAEDVTAQTFLAALEYLPKYRHNGHFASWLFSIARNKTVDYFRGISKEVSLEAAESIPADVNLPQEAVRTERTVALLKLIKSLPDHEQELIRLRYIAELSFAEIGQLLGQKEDTAKKSLYRLLARLKIQLEDSHA